MNLNTFFASASPHTLASLIVDIDQWGEGADNDQLALRTDALLDLVGTVGPDEAAEIIKLIASCN